MLTSLALVEIERPTRYGKQLANHIANRVQMDEVDGGWNLHIGDGLGEIRPHDDATPTRLELRASAETPEMLARVKEVLGKHLLQFTTKLPAVTITWNDN
jgi:hypothetical protein